ncbi:hypothetical protein BCON_0144g00060 [Botryotinia convoluta]|uniref:Uncharacterized protein n=1 Tax=Botryotinia convoluta TaxID=54673 RepID=A0A4Z1HT15_9HELO|nr:hypothetical protein BCON_0144g00060 [Botryotinia convoluta]
MFPIPLKLSLSRAVVVICCSGGLTELWLYFVKLYWKKEGSSRDTTLCSRASEDGRDRSDKEVNMRKTKKNSGDHGAVYPNFLADILDFYFRYYGMRGIKAGTGDVLAVLASLGTLIEKELLSCKSVGNMELSRVCLWAIVMIVNDIW